LRSTVDRNSRIGITGTPATGKKTIGIELAKITGLEYISINELAITRRAGRWRKGEFCVDPRLLRGKIRTRGRIVSGHLLPYVIPRGSMDYVVVLRASPAALKKRYRRRGYSMKKSLENIESEVLDIISSKAVSAYGSDKVFEFDTTRSRNPRNAAKKILAMLEGKLPRHSRKVVNWASGASKSPGRLRSVLKTLGGSSQSLKNRQKTEKDN